MIDKGSAEHELLLKAARLGIAELNDLIDGLMRISRTARTPGKYYLTFEERIAHTTVGVIVAMPRDRQAAVIAVLLERLLDQEALDKGVPK